MLFLLSSITVVCSANLNEPLDKDYPYPTLDIDWNKTYFKPYDGVTVGNIGMVYGWNDNGLYWHVFEKIAGFFYPSIDLLSGSFNSLSIGADGCFWMVNSANQLMVSTLSGLWNAPRIGLGAQQVSVGNANNIWALDLNNKVYQWNSNINNWLSHNEISLMWISAASDGSVAGLDANGVVHLYQNYNWALIDPAPVSFTSISHGSATNIWALSSFTNANNIWQWSKTYGWVNVLGKANYIDVAADGTVVVILSTYMYYIFHGYSMV